MQKIFVFTLAVILSFNFTLAQQAVTISGTITNKVNEPLIGANVYITGTTIGTATDANGRFKLKNVKTGSYQLCASYLGYKKYRQDIILDSELSGIEIIMNEAEGNLGEIVVTGTGTPHHVKTAPVPTELINSKFIERAAAQDFVSLAGSISPSFDFSPGIMGSFMQLNGLSNDFIIILIDGKRVSGDLGGMNDLGRISPNNLERVEVVKGASSSLYGSDAIAGVINIITKKSNRNFSVSNNTQYSNYNTLQQTNNIDFNSKRVSGHTSFAQKQSDGWQNSPYELDRNDSLVTTDAMTQNKYLNRNIRQDFEFRFTDNLSITTSASYYFNDIMVPETVKDYGYFFEDVSYNVGAKYLISKTSRVLFDYNSDKYNYYYKYNYNDEDGDFRKDQLKLNSEQLRQDYNLRWIARAGKNQTITLGSELVDEKYSSEGRLENDSENVNTLSLYVQDEIKLLKSLMITAGFRFVKHENFGSIGTPKLSLLYKLKNVNFRGTYSRGFKAPTLKEQYYYYEKRGTLYLGNTNLDAQQSDYYSVGIDYHNKWLTSNLSVYQNNVNDLIAYKSVDTIQGDGENGITRRRQHYNIEDARTQGVDFMLNVKLPYGFNLGGGYSYVDARNLTDSVRLEYVAHNYANVRAGYNQAWTKYRINVLLLGRIQDEKFFEDKSAKGFNLWKLTTTHEFPEFSGIKLIGTLGIDNIFDFVDDSPYGSHYGTISPGRTYFIGLNIRYAK